MIKFIKNLFKKKEELDYPSDFAIIRFTDVAFEGGVKGDSNKIIERYYYDSMGDLKVKKYRYSPERVFVLRKTFGIPIYDKTEQELTFPIAGRIEMGVVKFKTR